VTRWLDSEEADGLVLREQLLNDKWRCTLNIKNVTANCNIGFLQIVSLGSHSSAQTEKLNELTWTASIARVHFTIFGPKINMEDF